MDDEFHGIDLLFAKRFSQETEGEKILMRLLRTVREGKLSLTVTEEEIKVVREKLYYEGIVLEGDKLYLKRHFLLRKRFYRELERICNAPLSKEITLTLPQGLRERQLEALRACQEHNFWMITGGPGSGKSFTLAGIISAFSHSLSLVATAPTGKATARLRELLPLGKYDAMTLHRLLKVGSHESVETLHYDLVLVDESSMVDVALFTHLVSAIKSGSRLILVGDHEQLPPVEGASYFRELVEERTMHATFLQGSMRVEREDLLELAAKARRGETLPSEPMPPPEQLLRELEEHLLFRPEDGFEKLSKFKLLSPLRKGIYGVDFLNERCRARQKELYPEAAVPIMVTINDSRFDLYNGDMGLMRGDELFFPDGRKLSRFCLRGYELAYALSVHKSQGSEYDEVVLLLPEAASRFGRELLYTAITRAKKSVRIFHS